jgi:HEAT repeat protein
MTSMSNVEQAILDRLNADNWAALYRCRWSRPDAEQVIPQLEELLKSQDPLIIDEALRGLFRIGTPAVAAASSVATLIDSPAPITRHMAVLTLGSIAHEVPELCVEPLASVLSDPLCCKDAMRTLAFIGRDALSAIERVHQRFCDPDAKIRKAVVLTAAAIGATHPGTIELLSRASTDRSKVVRDAAARCLKKGEAG